MDYIGPTCLIFSAAYFVWRLMVLFDDVHAIREWCDADYCDHEEGAAEREPGP